MISTHTTVGVVGAGTMGSGIAQVAAVAGHPVVLVDAAPGAADAAASRIREQVALLVARGRLTLQHTELNLRAAQDLSALAHAGLVVEAITEDLGAKRRLMRALEAVVGPDCVLATNTSSLSPTDIASATDRPDRVVGMHFFNPVPRMALLEVVPGSQTAVEVVENCLAVARAWGKTPVRSTPTPGFIVNRVARPYYAEAWRLLARKAASPHTIDAVLTGAAGFPMGPFALMDLIGHDVNQAVTESVWNAFDRDPRFEPSPAQAELVRAGRLGRKSGQGIYDHAGDPSDNRARPRPRADAPAYVHDAPNSELQVLIERSGVPVRPGARAIRAAALPDGTLLARCQGLTADETARTLGAAVVLIDRTLDDATAQAVAIAASPDCPPSALQYAIGLLQAAGLDVHIVDDVPGLVVTRTVTMLVNLAHDAVEHGVATPESVDAAMRLGAGHPIGPFAWEHRWTTAVFRNALQALAESEDAIRYRPAAALTAGPRTQGAKA